MKRTVQMAKAGIPKANSQTKKIKPRKDWKPGPLIHVRPVRDATQTFLDDNAKAAQRELGAKAKELLPRVFARAKALLRAAKARAELLGAKLKGPDAA